jgi:hypothetical protein
MKRRSTMYKLASTMALVGLVALVTACDSSASATPAGSAATAGANAKASGPLVINIPKLGLKGLAPGETEQPILGDGEPILLATAGFTVTLAAAKPTDPKTLKDGQKAAELFTPKNSKSETLPDGWVLTYENTGSAGTNYFVNSRREIGGKGYLCETAQNTLEQQAKAVAFCKSLSK